MATLQNISGRSLVPSLDKSLGIALQAKRDFDAKEQAEAERQAEAARQAEIDALIGSLSGQAAASGATAELQAQPLGIDAPQITLPELRDPGAKQTTEEAALLRLGAIDPALATSARATLDRGDAQELAALTQISEQGSRDAAFVSGQPDFASKQRAITSLAEAAAARGEPLDRFIELQNMSENRLDLELQKMKIASTDLQTLLKPKGQFAPVTDAQGNIIAQQNLETGQVVTDPRAITPSTPTTAIGKARSDLEQGFITQADFNTIQNTPGEFKTDVGKLIADRKLAVELFGEDSPQVAAMDAAIKSDSKGEQPKLSDIGGIRKEFTKLSGDFIKMRSAIGKVRQAATDPSAAGDLAMIFSFMKILDPGSVVRESEFATAQNTAGVPERIRAQYNRILSGERLSEKQRQDFLDTANRGFETQLKTQQQLEQSFRALAERQNMNPDDVVLDFVGETLLDEIDEEVTTTIQEGTTATNPSTGQQLIFRGGQWQTL